MCVHASVCLGACGSLFSFLLLFFAALLRCFAVCAVLLFVLFAIFSHSHNHVVLFYYCNLIFTI